MKKTPEYLNIYEKLKNDITEGVYPSGTKLPSKRVAADRFGVSVITVQHAYDLLEDEGYMTPRERSGYFVSYDPSDVFGGTGRASAGDVYESQDISGIEPFILPEFEPFPFSVYAKAVRRILSEKAEAVLVKAPGQGCQELREALSGYLARSRGIKVTPDRIVIGSGAEYLYGMIIDMLGRYRSYGIEDPSYGKILQVYKLNGAHTELLKLGRNGIRTSELEKSGAGVLHITPYRSYPSGISADASKKREYLSYARTRGAWIIEDDFESEYSPSSKPEETLFQIDGGVRVIYVNSFSITISPGIRIAYMVLPKLLTEVYKDRVGFCSCSVPTLDQLVLAELLSAGDFERHINRVRRKLRRS
jgi:GntR family transcriptional regulator/MocR family aminotransferase